MRQNTIDWLNVVAKLAIFIVVVAALSVTLFHMLPEYLPVAMKITCIVITWVATIAIMARALQLSDHGPVVVLDRRLAIHPRWFVECWKGKPHKNEEMRKADDE